MKTLCRERDKQEILRRLKRVRPDSVRRWGRMSAHQMVCHLSDSFRAMIGRKAVTPVTSPFQRPVVKCLALYAPLRWPPGILTSPEIDQEAGGTKPADFATDLADLEALVELLTDPVRRFEWHEHPIFGRMSDRSWFRWAYLHMDHHLRQFGL
jgi:hypothetical protein